VIGEVIAGICWAVALGQFAPEAASLRV